MSYEWQSEEFETLAKDLERGAARLRKASYVEYRKDAAENLYPLLTSILQALDERVAVVEGALADVLNESSIIHEGLAQQLHGLINIGNTLAQQLEGTVVDDVTKQRFREVLEAWKMSVPLVTYAIQEATVDDDEDEDEDEDEDAESEAPEAPIEASDEETA